MCRRVVCRTLSYSLGEAARLWKKENNGIGKNGELAPDCPIFLRFFFHFLPISHTFFDISQNVSFGNFTQFPIPPISPHSPHPPPFCCHFFISPIFPSPCG